MTSEPEDGSAEGAGTGEQIAPTDYLALARHVATLAQELERVWSAGLDAALLSAANEKLAVRVRTLINALTESLEKRDERLHEIGVDVVLPEWPMSTGRLIELLESSDDRSSQRALLVAAQLQAFELVARSLGALTEPSARSVRITQGGQIEEKWWESGAFALLQSRAQLLRAITLELDALDAAIKGEEVGHQREAADALRAAIMAYRRGDPHAALLGALHAAAMVVPEPTSANDGRWSALESNADFAGLAQLIARAESIIDDLIGSPRRLSWGFALPLVAEILPGVERLVFAPPEL